MGAVQLMDGIYWVGIVDWNLRYFHGYSLSTHRGTTYNAYLIIDEKVTLVDTVYTPFAEDLLKNISEVIDPSKIDYVICNHLESDHSGSLPKVMEQAPGATVFCSPRCEEGLKKHFQKDWDIQVVKSGTELSLGKRTLTFIEAPMLHWPDSMFTYVKEDGLLMPNDAFGQHYASSKRFDDEVDLNIVMEEAAKYYANILYPFGKLVLKKIEELKGMNIPINMIAPSHGIIWRKDIGMIIEEYVKWASGKGREKIVVAYDTMWHSTEKMAFAIIEGIQSEGVEAQLFRLPLSDHNDIIKEILEGSAVILGSSTIHKDFLPTLAPLLDEIVALKPGNKLGAAFGSYGWSSGAVESIEEKLSKAKIERAMEALKIKWAPNEEELKQCFNFGKEMAVKVKAR